MKYFITAIKMKTNLVLAILVVAICLTHVTGKPKIGYYRMLTIET